MDFCFAEHPPTHHITSTALQSAYPTEKPLQAGQSEQRLGAGRALNRQAIKQTKLKRKYYTLAHCEKNKQFFDCQSFSTVIVQLQIKNKDPTLWII